jgi:hypothetical protein
MTILRCFDPSAGNTTDWAATQAVWYWSSFALIFFYFVLFLFGIIPIIKYWEEFKSLNTINIAARICFTIALFLKFVVHIVSLIPLHDYLEMKYLRFCGLVFFSLPSYFITTCFSIVLISWIMICMQILPLKIVEIFKKAKWSLVIYNVLIYLMFIASVCIEFEISDPPKPLHKKLHRISGYFDIFRDIVLFVLFFAFVILLQKGLGNDEFTESSLEQRKLYWIVIILGILMLLRGIISLVQVLLDSSQECGMPFFSAYIISEVFIEGIPLLILLGINNGFLGTRRRMSIDISNPLLYTSN